MLRFYALKVDLDLKDNAGHTALDLATRRNFHTVADFLERKKPNGFKFCDTRFARLRKQVGHIQDSQ